jgi:hypothetical protein
LSARGSRGSGVGTIANYHTVHELNDLVKALGYEQAQLLNAYMAASGVWSQADPQGFADFSARYTAAQGKWDAAMTLALGALQSASATSSPDWDHTLAVVSTPLPRDAVDWLAEQYIDLAGYDREMRIAAAKYGFANPVYPKVPQPQAPDFDLKLYNAIGDLGLPEHPVTTFKWLAIIGGVLVGTWILYETHVLKLVGAGVDKLLPKKA